MTTDQPKTAAQWADEFYAGDDCRLSALFAAAMAQARAAALTQAREAALGEAIAVCREIEARDLGSEEWLHARRCAAAIEALRAQAAAE